MKKCVVCGKPVKPSNLTSIDCGHGKIQIPCHYLGGCQTTLIARMQGGYTIGILDLNDLEENRHMTREELDKLTPEQERKIAEDVSDIFWDNNEGLTDAVETAMRLTERHKIEDMEQDMLPTLIGAIRYPQNQAYFEKRLKGDKK
jgi:hypothetical protein